MTELTRVYVKMCNTNKDPRRVVKMYDRGAQRSWMPWIFLWRSRVKIKDYLIKKVIKNLNLKI